MPIDPQTGQMIPYGNQQELPLAFRMMEDLPGIASTVGFSAMRGSNTIMRGGGFLDSPEGGRGIFAGRRADRYRVFNGSTLSDVSPNQFIGSSSRRASAAASGKQGFLRSSRVNNLTMRPRALTRFHSLSVFGPASANMYTPFAASAMIGRSKKASSALGLSGTDSLGPGLLSFVTAGVRADRLEARAFNGSKRAMRKLGGVDSSISRLANMNNPLTIKFGAPVSVASATPAGRAAASLANLPVANVNLASRATSASGIIIPGAASVHSGGPLLGPNGRPIGPVYGPPLPTSSPIDGRPRINIPTAKTGISVTPPGLQPSSRFPGSGLKITSPYPSSPVQNTQLQARKMVFGGDRTGIAMGKAVTKEAGAGVGQVGVRGNLLASSLAGAGTRKMAGYARGAMGYGRAAAYEGLDDTAKKGARLAEKQFLAAFRSAGLGNRTAAYTAMQAGNLYGTIGAKGIAQMATSGGAKVLAARGAALAVPGLNVLATASLVYDLGKMAGEVVKSGINLARDADKSIRGSIHKPMFGMGYVDTEAAATSRARGVMAIQNSRLNARSMLGSEAAMMAAHYG